jgi:hypothetical protein
MAGSQRRWARETAGSEERACRPPFQRSVLEEKQVNGADADDPGEGQVVMQRGRRLQKGT